MNIERRLLLTSLLPLRLLAQKDSAAPKEPGKDTSLAPYFPTPESIVERMLRLGDLKAGEKMFDLGSGDGRIIILAARKFKADATGVELDPELYRRSTDKIKKLGLE